MSLSDELALTPQDFSSLTPEQILASLRTLPGWPMSNIMAIWDELLELIREYLLKVVDWIWDKLEAMKDTLVEWFEVIKDWVKDIVVPWFNKVWSWIKTEVGKLWDDIVNAFDKVWDWLKSVRDWLWEHIEDAFDWVWDKLQGIWSALGKIPGIVAEKVAAINKWFSDEFIDPFIDWLLVLPKNLWEAFLTPVNALLIRLETFMTSEKGSLGTWISNWRRRAWAWLQAWAEIYWDELQKQVKDFHSPLWIAWYAIAGIAVAALIGALTAAGGAIVIALRLAFNAVLRLGPAIGGWFATLFSKGGGWLLARGAGLGAWLLTLLPRSLTWLGKHWFPVFTSALILGLGATGTLDGLIDKFITPKIMELMSWAESMGPVAPDSGANAMTSVTKLITFTVSGLATMTLMGESLALFKHLGMGHISAMLYDLANYKVLTAAFVGVLAAVYIKTPLSYYYNKIARPNIPDERQLMALASEYMLAEPGDVQATIEGKTTFAQLAGKNEAKFIELMAYHGFSDGYSRQLFQQADTPMRYFALSAVARSGTWDEQLFRDELRNSGYSARGCETLLDAFRREATSDLKSLMVGVATSRYREGFDDQATLSQNLLALGVQPTMLPKYLFACELAYLTDYQADLMAYYKDAYHRREINDTQFVEAVASLGLPQERVDAIYEREKLKRLKVSSTPAPVVKTLTATQVGALYKRGKLKVDDAMSRLATYLPIISDRQLFLLLYEPGEPELPL